MRDDDVREGIAARNAQRHTAMSADLARKNEPWHVGHCRDADPAKHADWSRRAKAWCDQNVNPNSTLTLRTHLQCEKCGFGFIARTSNYSLSSSSDVENVGVCLDPDCRYSWVEIS